MVGGNTLYKEFKELTNELNVEMKSKLESISNIDIELLMSNVIEALEKEYKVYYTDDNTIMLKVDRRKNINIILNNIENTLRDVISQDHMSLLFKTRVSDGMITIKRRR